MSQLHSFLKRSNLRLWVDKDVDENDVKDSWEDDDEPTRPPAAAEPPAVKAQNKSVVTEEPLDPVAEKLCQQSSRMISVAISVIPECVEEGSEEDLPYSKWSSLPFLVLWMVKDRLDFFNNAKVPLVCRHWWQASINYPTKLQTVGDGMPWIMVNAGGNKKCFVNAERTKEFAVEMPEFNDYRPLFSRKGWILLTREKEYTDDRKNDLLKLINPLTKGKIELRDVVIECDEEERGYHFHTGCFSNGQDGCPNYVAISYLDHWDDGELRLYITYVGVADDQKVWTEQVYFVKGPFDVGYMAIIDSHVYMCCPYGAMIIYNMSEQTWKEIEAPLIKMPWRPSFKLMELEGGAIGILGTQQSVRWFYKYSLAHNCWQRFANEDEEANGLMLFGGQRYYDRAIWKLQKRGLYVYTIISEPSWGPDTGRKWSLHYKDYLLGEVTKSTIKGRATWVNIG